MIEILKKLVEDKIKRPVQNRRDCELVSNAILETLDVDISYSTIKRFYGLNSFAKPNNNTLNILSQFIGYKNYAHFNQTQSFKERNNLLQTIYKVISEDNEQKIIELVLKSKNNAFNFIDFIIISTRELLHKKNDKLVDQIFNLKEINYSNLSYTDVLYLGNSIGLIFRKNKLINSVLISNINFLNCVYATFVDYSSLNGFYGKWTKIINKQNIDENIKIFSSALLQLKKYLNKKPVKIIYKDMIFSKELHPILCSRLLSIYFLTKNKIETEKILDEYFLVHSKKKYLVDYSHELFITAILTKNDFLMMYLINKINFNDNLYFMYQKYHLNLFYLMCLFYFRLTLNEKEENRYNKLFSLENCTNGYENFVMQLHLIYLYNINNDTLKKNQVRTLYNESAKKLKYPIFNEDFLINYFKRI